MLRLAPVIGEDPREFKIIDLLPAAKSNPCWEKVTIGDCLNMATVIGSGAIDTGAIDTSNGDAKAPDKFADYYMEKENSLTAEKTSPGFGHHHAGHQAQPSKDKSVWTFPGTGYPRAVGAVARYRDQDVYIATATLEALLIQARRPSSRLWRMVNDEVLKPAKIRHAIQFHTINDDESPAFSSGDAELLLTMNDIACLGRLIFNRGEISGTTCAAAGYAG
ncbi:MAG: hypothetical protein ACI9LO_003208 [Planctomycetota bacterium]|jgi:hypothetical protein